MLKRFSDCPTPLTDQSDTGRTLLILAATEGELHGLADSLQVQETFDFLGETFRVAAHGNFRLIFGTTGIGKVNAALMTASLLQHLDVEAVWLTGIAGAYPDTPPAVGDVFVTDRIVFGDEGVLLEDAVQPNSEIGFPLFVQGGEKIFDAFRIGRYLEESGLAGLFRADTDYLLTSEGGIRLAGTSPDFDPPSPDRPQTGASGDSSQAPLFSGSEMDSEAPTTSLSPTFRIVTGTSLTVGMASGDAATACYRRDRYQVWSENMEGSAVARACARVGVNFAECRGISNTAGDRDKAGWRIDAAVRRAHAVLFAWLDCLICQETP